MKIAIIGSERVGKALASSSVRDGSLGDHQLENAEKAAEAAKGPPA